MSSSLGVRFYPTEVELVNFLKKFLKGELLSCPIKFAEIYGDQPPWAILGAEEKTGYFITPLRKQKKSERHCRTCADGTWRGQTSGNPIKNHKKCIVGFRKNYKYQIRSKKQKKNSGTNTIKWLMREYFVGDDFFTKNNIPKQDFAICRIKKYIKEKKTKDDTITFNMEEHVGIIEGMLHVPDANDFMIDNQQAEVHNEEYDLRECKKMNDQMFEISTEDAQIEQVQGNVGDTIIGSNDFWEAINGILKHVTVTIPDDLWQLDNPSPLQLIVNENI